MFFIILTPALELLFKKKYIKEFLTLKGISLKKEKKKIFLSAY